MAEAILELTPEVAQEFNDASKFELSKLYQQRRHVELDFRNIKTTLGMRVLPLPARKRTESRLYEAAVYERGPAQPGCRLPDVDDLILRHVNKKYLQ